MLVVEADALNGEPSGYPARNFGLTNSATDLIWKCNDDVHSQGNYDYNAHAQVYVGGADPLGSQGYASVVGKSFQLFRRGPRSQKLAGVFVYGRHVAGKAGTARLGLKA